MEEGGIKGSELSTGDGVSRSVAARMDSKGARGGRGT